MFGEDEKVLYKDAKNLGLSLTRVNISFVSQKLNSYVIIVSNEGLKPDPNIEAIMKMEPQEMKQYLTTTEPRYICR